MASNGNKNDDARTSTVPKNPPQSIIISSNKNADKTKKSSYSTYSVFSDYNNDASEMYGEGNLSSECQPHICSSSNLSETNEPADDKDLKLPSVTSVLDFEVVHGILNKNEYTRSETEAFVPVGGMVAPEKKRQEFREYLHKKGFLHAISKVLVSLYDEPELPAKEKAMEYITKCLGFHLTIKSEVKESKAYAHMLKGRIQRLQVENDWMRRHLDNYETTETALDTIDPTNLPPIKYLKLEPSHHHQPHKHGHHHHHRESKKGEHMQYHGGHNL